MQLSSRAPQHLVHQQRRRAALPPPPPPPLPLQPRRRPAAAAAANNYSRLQLSSCVAVYGKQQQQQQRQLQQQWRAAAASGDGGASSSDDSNKQKQQQQPQRAGGFGGLMTAFDRLPARVQLGVMGGLIFVAFIVVPFLQPTFLYGSGDAAVTIPTTPAARASAAAAAAAAAKAAAEKRYALPRYVPGLSEAYDWLQDSAMPRVNPYTGRTESPGVLRIYLAAMAILAAFYACSAVVGALARVAAAGLRAAGLSRQPGGGGGAGSAGGGGAQ